MDSLACLATLTGHSGAVRALAASPDRVFSGSDDTTIKACPSSPSCLGSNFTWVCRGSQSVVTSQAERKSPAGSGVLVQHAVFSCMLGESSSCYVCQLCRATADVSCCANFAFSPWQPAHTWQLCGCACQLTLWHSAAGKALHIPALSAPFLLHSSHISDCAPSHIKSVPAALPELFWRTAFGTRACKRR